MKFFFAWYDGWIGYFWDGKKRRLYICPLPWCVFQFQFSQQEQKPDPHWESVPAIEDGKLIGYQVRWSEPDELGRYLWVGHYYAATDDMGPSIRWCEVAANHDAKNKNMMKKLPCEYKRC